MKRIWILLALVLFTRPDGTKVWLNRDRVVKVVGASPYCLGATEITLASGYQCVLEPAEQVAEALR